MKKAQVLFGVALLSCLTGCQSRENSDEVVCQTVHRYGVALEPDDWSSRGKNGQVISVRKDGVTVTRNYDKGVLHGECCYSYPYRDVVQKREHYTQGGLVKECTYYPSGCPEVQVEHDAGCVRRTSAWYENGAPYAKEVYKEDKLLQGEYILPDGQVESRIDDGAGVRTKRGPQGELLSVDTVQKGLVCKVTTYHPCGSPSAVTAYNNGVIEGTRWTYLPGGEPATAEEWVGGIQEGTTIVYEYGEKRAEVPYVSGHPHGIERRFCDNGGAVAQERSWVNGQLHGPTHSYVGGTTKTDWYFCNKPVPNKATFDMLSSQ